VTYERLISALLAFEARLGPAPVILVRLGRDHIVEYLYGPGAAVIWRRTRRSRDTDPPVPVSLLEVAPVYDLATVRRVTSGLLVQYVRRGLWGDGRSGYVHVFADGRVAEVR